MPKYSAEGGDSELPPEIAKILGVEQEYHLDLQSSPAFRLVKAGLNHLANKKAKPLSSGAQEIEHGSTFKFTREAQDGLDPVPVIEDKNRYPKAPKAEND